MLTGVMVMNRLIINKKPLYNFAVLKYFMPVHYLS